MKKLFFITLIFSFFTIIISTPSKKQYTTNQYTGKFGYTNNNNNLHNKNVKLITYKNLIKDLKILNATIKNLSNGIFYQKVNTIVTKLSRKKNISRKKKITSMEQENIVEELKNIFDKKLYKSKITKPFILS
jgi:hypothetical protein